MEPTHDPEKLPSVSEFAARIRQKYPNEYDEIGDQELVERTVRKQPIYADQVALPAEFRLLTTSSGYPKIDEIYERAARAENVDANLLLEIGRQESINFKPEVVYGRLNSPKGARGISQFMPGTAPLYGLKVGDGVDERTDPIKSIHAQARYLRKLLGDFGGDEKLAMAGYNAGEGAVRKYGNSVPPYRETRDYVSRISAKLAEARQKVVYSSGGITPTNPTETFTPQGELWANSNQVDLQNQPGPDRPNNPLEVGIPEYKGKRPRLQLLSLPKTGGSVSVDVGELKPIDPRLGQFTDTGTQVVAPQQRGKGTDDLNRIAAQVTVKLDGIPTAEKLDYSLRKAYQSIAGKYGLSPEQVEQGVQQAKDNKTVGTIDDATTEGTIEITNLDLANILGHERFIADERNRQAQARVGLEEIPTITKKEIQDIAGWETRLPAAINSGGARTGTWLAGIARLASPARIAGIEDVADPNLKPREVRAYGSPKEFYDQMQANAKKNAANWETIDDKTWTSEIINIAGGATSDIPRTVIQSVLPGGIVTAMSLDMAGQSSGRGQSMDEVATEAAKGAILGGIARLAFPVGQKWAAETGSKVAGGGAALAFTGAATYPTSRLFGADEKTALKESLYNVVFALADASPILLGKTVRIKDTNGDKLAVKIDEKGTVQETTLPADTPADLEVVAPAPKAIAKPVDASPVVPDQAPAKKVDKLTQLFTAAEKQIGVPDKPVTNSRQKTARDLRANLASAVRSFDQAEHTLADAKKEFGKRNAADNYEFITKVEKGDYNNLSPEDKATARNLRIQLDSARARVQALGKGKLEHFYTNYFPHLWEDPKKAAKVFAGNFEGTKNFLKPRTIETFAEGLAAGLKPVHDNPIDSVLTRIREMDRYVAAHKTMDSLKSEGLVKFVKDLDTIPEGFVYLDDAIGQTTGGRYYAVKGAAKILNRHLSPSLNQFKIYRGYRAVGNLLTQAQLSMSAFHLGFTTFDAMISKLSLAFEQAGSGRPLQALKSAAEVPISAFTNPVRGHKLMKEWFEPGSTRDPAMKVIAELMVEAGGRAKMDDFYHTKATDVMVKAFKEANIYSWEGVKNAAKGTAYTIPTALEQLSRPIMELVVPRQKMGVFADLAKSELERLGPDATKEQVREAMQSVWDSVDNRMGEMVYDNLFWDRVAKDLAMASVQSVGWNLGSLRELTGGVKDTIGMPKRIYNAATGKVNTEPILSHRQAYLSSMTVFTGIAGAITQYLALGEWPTEMKDYFYPRINEEGDRVQLPSYLKDVYSVSQHPVTTASHKLHPLPRLLGETLTNQDYYSNEIRNADDPLVKQGLDLLQHVGKTFTPYSFRGYQQSVKRGTSTTMTVLPFFGVTPAPGSVNRNTTGLMDQLTSPAEKMLKSLQYKTQKAISSLSQSKPVDDQKKEILKADIRRKLQAGDESWNKDFNKAVEAGILKREDRADVTNYLKNRIMPLSLDDALKVYEVSNQYERGQLYSLMLMKQHSYEGRFTPAQVAKLKELNLY